jgi:hypothetical protein
MFKRAFKNGVHTSSSPVWKNALHLLCGIEGERSKLARIRVVDLSAEIDLMQRQFKLGCLIIKYKK